MALNWLAASHPLLLLEYSVLQIVCLLVTMIGETVRYLISQPSFPLPVTEGYSIRMCTI